MKTARARRSGFTLLEVLLVVAILVILAGAAVVTYRNVFAGAKKDTVVAVISQVETALETYQLHIGHFPTQEEGGLGALRTQPNFSEEGLGEKWHGPYLKVDPTDPWGKALNYQVVDPGSEEAKAVPFKVWSNGPNGTDENGEGDDVKNKSWAQATGK